MVPLPLRHDLPQKNGRLRFKQLLIRGGGLWSLDRLIEIEM